MVSKPISALAHAKINLVLEVLGIREDGYHEIDTILQEVALADVVTVTPAAVWAIDVTGPRAAGTPQDASNLALSAAMLLAERVEGSCPVRISLEKHVPAAGGLGGGASDAAATLRLIAKIWPRTAWQELEIVANQIGSDEAFFLVGGTARAEGRGERVTPLPPLEPHDVVLFVPEQTIERKTPRMFAALDQHGFDGRLLAEGFQADRPDQVTMQATFNAFERVAFDLFPGLGELWEDLERRTGETVRLAGAGPCMFWIGPFGGAEVAARAAGAGCEVILTRTVART
jgi:4-diphosphocytidyl-2-C-methyl-D-erythritol kinase